MAGPPSRSSEFFIRCGAIDQERYRVLTAVRPRSKSFTVNQAAASASRACHGSHSRPRLDESARGYAAMGPCPQDKGSSFDRRKTMHRNLLHGADLPAKEQPVRTCSRIRYLYFVLLQPRLFGAADLLDRKSTRLNSSH